jgi:hypothetical protein
MRSGWLVSLFLILFVLIHSDLIAGEERVFLGDLIRSQDGVFVQLDLSTIRKSRNISDENLAKLFTKVSRKQPYTDDITIDIGREHLLKMLPPYLVDASQKFTVVLDSQVFTATAHKFVLQNNFAVEPAWLLGLQLAVPDSVKIPEKTDKAFVIASLDELLAPVVYQQADVVNAATVEFLEGFGSEALAEAKRRMKDWAKRRKTLPPDQLHLLETFERPTDPQEGGKFTYFTGPPKNECVYASYTSGEVTGFSALYKYCSSDKKVQTITAMEFDYLSIRGSSGTIVELDVDHDSVNEVFFRVTFYEGGQTIGYRKDPSGKMIPFLKTVYSGT